MRRKLFLPLLLWLMSSLPGASFGLFGGRDTLSLGGQWNYIVDPMNTGIYKFQMQLQKPHKRYFADRHFFQDKSTLIEYDFDHAPTLRVPGDWNTQLEKLYYYEGSVWYRRKVDFAPVAGRRWFLYFGAVNYQCMVGLNNTILGEHKGGFTPFWFEVTDVLKEGENSLVVWVNNTRGPSEVPTVNFDWWNYGGITRDVLLVSVPEVFIRDYRITFDGSEITLSASLDGGTAPVTVEIPELKLKKTVSAEADGVAQLRFKASPERWSPENPRLYEISVSAGEDRISDRVGFRTIRTEGEKILLNDKPVFLRGVAVHDESIGVNPGRCRGKEDVRALLETARDLGCNFLRLAHYPHSEEMVRLAEEMGFLLWEEIPCYWNIDWSSEETYANAENQLMELIRRDANRAAVIIWSVANETPRTPERLSFLGRLIARARETDPTRLISAAMEKEKPDFYHPVVEDELMALTDLISFNQYYGWYDGKPADCDRVSWTIPAGKPVVISEFGGGALYGNYGSDAELFTEEYLALLYRKNLEMLEKIPALCGLSPWCLKDFRSPKRPLPGIQDDFNRKGLVDEQGRRKLAFYIVRQAYDRIAAQRGERPAAGEEAAIPSPVFEDRPEYVSLYWTAWEQARAHIKYQPGLVQPLYMDEGFRDEAIWIWDSEFMVLFCKYAPKLFPGIQTLDNFYYTLHESAGSPLSVWHPDNPPFFAWVENDYYKFTGDKAHIRELIRDKRFLQKHFELFNSMTPDSQFPFPICNIGVAVEYKGIGYNWNSWQSGMDNTPRKREMPLFWVDAISQQALSALYISRLARVAGDRAAEKEYKEKYEDLKEKVNRYYWDEGDGCYYDIREDDHSKTHILTPASFWPMIAEIPSREQAEAMVRFALREDKLGGAVPWVSVSRDDTDFDPDGNYWRGSMWLPTAYMGIKALEKYGFFAEANHTSEAILEHMWLTYSQYEPHTIWECYNPSKPEPASKVSTASMRIKSVKADFCGWSALGPISLFIENVLGFYEVDASSGVVRWNLHQSGRHGIEKLSFGDITTDIIYDSGKVTVVTNKPYSLYINGRKHAIRRGLNEISPVSPGK